MSICDTHNIFLNSKFLLIYLLKQTECHCQFLFRLLTRNNTNLEKS